MSRVAWRFTDPVTSDEYFLPVNPKADSGSHAIVKNVRYQASASTYTDNGNNIRVNDTVAQSAPFEQEAFFYTGFTYTKAQLDAMKLWTEKNYPWQMRDDLGREFMIYVETFNIERVRSRSYRWKHSYTFTGIVLEEI